MIDSIQDVLIVQELYDLSVDPLLLMSYSDLSQWSDSILE